MAKLLQRRRGELQDEPVILGVLKRRESRFPIDTCKLHERSLLKVEVAAHPPCN
jgi:hypothetical protein